MRKEIFMKIKQFKECIKRIADIHDVDLVFTENEFNFYIVSGPKQYATVSKSEPYLMNTGYPVFKELEENLRGDLLEVLYKLADTPISERQEEKKYYLKHRFLVEDGDCNYLNYDHSLRELNLSDIGQSKSIQTQFTLEEIEKIKVRYYTTLDDFEQIEVDKK